MHARDLSADGLPPVAGSDPYRPQFHFSPSRNWLNDPNGLVHHRGLYHLFFQYNPSGTSWGNMSWGHAVSRDLARWDEWPVALMHDDEEEVYSGSAVVDVENTAGFGTRGAQAIVAIYTSSSKATRGQAQSLAFSLDEGRSWTKHHDNPVLDIGSTDFRDPKVQWFEPTRSWLMVVSKSLEHTVAFYSSPDLKDWSLLSEFTPDLPGGDDVWECPDLFPLQVDGGRTTTWVLVVNVLRGGIAGGSAAQYFLGTFDGVTFVPDEQSEPVPGAARWVDHGKDYYAAVSWEDDPAGRHMIGWMSNWQYAGAVPTTTWRGAMSTPRRMSVLTVAGRPRLVQEPVGTLERRGPSVTRRLLRVSDSTLRGDLPRGTSYEIEAVIDAGDATHVGFVLRVGEEERTEVGFDVAAGTMYVDRTRSGDGTFSSDFPGVHTAPLGLHDGRVLLRILVDRCSVEVFGGRGESVITDLVFPSIESDGLMVFAEGGTAVFEHVTVWQVLP